MVVPSRMAADCRKRAKVTWARGSLRRAGGHPDDYDFLLKPDLHNLAGCTGPGFLDKWTA